MYQFLFYNEFIILIYMFRAQPCSSSGSQNFIIQHLALSHYAGGLPMHTCAFGQLLRRPYELPEDGQEPRPKPVGAIINKQKILCNKLMLSFIYMNLISVYSSV